MDQWIQILGIVLGAGSSLAWIFRWKQDKKIVEVDIESKENSIIIERRQLELDITANVIKELNAIISKQNTDIKDLKEQLAECLKECAACLKLVQGK